MDRKKRVLLLSPPLYTYFPSQKLINPFLKKFEFPYGLLSIASLLVTSGIQTEVLPLDYYVGGKLNRKRMLAKIRSLLADRIAGEDLITVGIGAYTIQYPLALEILRICKEVNEKSLTVIGGTHVTFWAEKCLGEAPWVDCVVRGEGEWALLDLVKAIPDQNEMDSVKGICYRKNGTIVSTEERPLGNLETLPPLDFSLLPRNFILNSNLYVYWERGCDKACIHCDAPSMWKRRIRSRGMEAARAEIDELKALGVKALSCDDGIFRRSPPIREDSLQFVVFSTLDGLTGDRIAAMKENGVRQINAEAISTRVSSLEGIVKTAKEIRKNGLLFGIYWIIGCPENGNPQGTLEAIEFLGGNGLVYSQEIALFVPFPGTEVFDDPDRYGVTIEHHNWEAYSHYNSRPVFTSKTMDAEQIYKAYLKANKFHNCRYL